MDDRLYKLEQGARQSARGFVRVRGAREHDLKNVDADVPRDALVGQQDDARIVDNRRLCRASGQRPHCVDKFGAAAWTGSSAMMSEAVHSVVDTNEVLLLYGYHRGGAAAANHASA